MDTKTNGFLHNNMKSSWTVSDSTLQPAIHLYGFGVASRKIFTLTEKPVQTLLSQLHVGVSPGFPHIFTT